MKYSGGAVRRDPSLPLPFGGGVDHKLELLCVVLQLLSLGFWGGIQKVRTSGGSCALNLGVHTFRRTHFLTSDTSDLFSPRPYSKYLQVRDRRD